MEIILLFLKGVKKLIKRFAVLSFLIAGLFIAATCGAFAADEGFHSPGTTMQYTENLYPEGNNYFYLPAKFETEIFEIPNGKFFGIQYFEYFLVPKNDFEVIFYTPCGVEIGRKRFNSVNTTYSVPHKANTLIPEKLKVKVINHSNDAKDFKFVMYTPLNAVNGVPSAKAKPICKDGCCGYTE